MTEALSAREHHTNGAVPAPDTDTGEERTGGTLLEMFATSLAEESERFRERLRDVRAQLSAHSEWLAARELRVTEDEQNLRAREEVLQTREDQLEQLQEEVEALRAEVDAAREPRNEASAAEALGLPREVSRAGLALILALGVLLTVTLPRLARTQRHRRLAKAERRRRAATSQRRALANRMPRRGS